MTSGGVRERRRGGQGTAPIRSSCDPSDLRDNHVAQEPSDPPAPHLSNALDLPRDQPNPHSVAEPNATVELGPWGGNGGEPWDDWAGFHRISQITLYYGNCIDAIEVVYVDKDNNPVQGPKRGDKGGLPTKFELGPDEYIVAVSGHYGEFDGLTVLRSLTFTTNQQKFGPVGPEEGTAFGLPVVHGHVVGFFGRSAKYLDAIGVHIVSN